MTPPTNTPATTPVDVPSNSGKTELPGDSTIVTPKGQDPIISDDGSATLPGGGTVTTSGGTEIEAPPGTKISEGGTITFPPDSGGTVTTQGGSEIKAPPGTSIQNDGTVVFPPDKGGAITTPGGWTDETDGSGNRATISVPSGTTISPDGSVSIPKGSGGATLTQGNGFNFNIHEDATIVLDENSAQGYRIAIDNPFQDVKESDWFFDYVMYAYARGLMTGTSASPMMLSPNMPITRGMIVTVLYRLAGNPDVNSESGIQNSEFSDVSEGAWYSDAVSWAAENGIVDGYGGGVFGPNDPITRQDLAVILMRYMNYKEIVLPVTAQWIIFADEAGISGYAMDAIQTLNKLGVINGTGTNADGQVVINPKGSATRAETAAMLQRFIELMAQ